MVRLGKLDGSVRVLGGGLSGMLVVGDVGAGYRGHRWECGVGAYELSTDAECVLCEVKERGAREGREVKRRGI